MWGIKQKINLTRQRIMEEIRNNQNIKQPQLMSLIGSGRTAIQKNVIFLRKNGYWKVYKYETKRW